MHRHGVGLELRGATQQAMHPPKSVPSHGYIGVALLQVLAHLASLPHEAAGACAQLPPKHGDILWRHRAPQKHAAPPLQGSDGLVSLRFALPSRGPHGWRRRLFGGPRETEVQVGRHPHADVNALRVACEPAPKEVRPGALCVRGVEVAGAAPLRDELVLPLGLRACGAWGRTSLQKVLQLQLNGFQAPGGGLEIRDTEAALGSEPAQGFRDLLLSARPGAGVRRGGTADVERGILPHVDGLLRLDSLLGFSEAEGEASTGSRGGRGGLAD
mmetsp:Transcript_67664/g.195916  ORF Transcript_67664/g.195916 Transcript_67664/m.195916 type:complete len:271 (+) Transcript_67664:593-1405(+)